jgi:hypothetical protein
MPSRHGAEQSLGGAEAEQAGAEAEGADGERGADHGDQGTEQAVLVAVLPRVDVVPRAHGARQAHAAPSPASQRDFVKMGSKNELAVYIASCASVFRDLEGLGDDDPRSADKGRH